MSSRLAQRSQPIYVEGPESASLTEILFVRDFWDESYLPDLCENQLRAIGTRLELYLGVVVKLNKSALRFPGRVVKNKIFWSEGG